MNPENAAAELLIKQATELSIGFGKIIADLIKGGAKNLAAMILAAATPKAGQAPTEEQIKGRQKIEKLLTGHTPAVLEIPFKDLKQFQSEAKKFKLPYAIIENKETEGADIVIRAKDAELFNRVMQRMGYGRVDIPTPPEQQEQTPENPIQDAARASTNESRQVEEQETAESLSSLTTVSIDESRAAGVIEYLGENGEVLMPIEFHDLGKLVESAKNEHEAGTRIRVAVNNDSELSIADVALPSEHISATLRELSDAGIESYIPATAEQAITSDEPPRENISDPEILDGSEEERAPNISDILDEVKSWNIEASFDSGSGNGGGITGRIDAAKTAADARGNIVPEIAKGKAGQEK